MAKASTEVRKHYVFCSEREEYVNVRAYADPFEAEYYAKIEASVDLSVNDIEDFIDLLNNIKGWIMARSVEDEEDGV